GLRETAGVDLDQVSSQFGYRFKDYFLQQMQDHLKSGRITHINGRYALAPHARFLADGIAADAFWLN
ncbi:MAG: coproporphyrinogen III oxidase, partial [Bacteroidota bacterium]